MLLLQKPNIFLSQHDYCQTMLNTVTDQREHKAQVRQLNEKDTNYMIVKPNISGNLKRLELLA